MSFRNKVALVTGASSGIGAAIAIKFAEEGASIVLVGRNVEKLRRTTQTCEEKGGKSFIIVADVSKDEDVKRIVKETIDRFGKLDILVNNAGIGLMTTIDAEDALSVFDNVMATNLRAVFYLTNLCVRHLTETKGNIINVSSVASTLPSSVVYATSKAALDHFSRCAALELAPKGVRVNAVNPGPVTTDIIINMGIPPEQEVAAWENMKKATALDRVGDPEEIADLVVYLASDKAKSITGSCFVSDNGILIKNGST